MGSRTPRRKPTRTPERPAGAPGLEDELLQRYSRAGTALIADEAPRKLDPTLRAEMETLTGAELSDVRLHSGPEARRMAATLGARAFTAGPADVFFAGGQLDPSSPKGKSLLAHELTHVAEGEVAMARVSRMPERENLEVRARRAEEMVLAREQAAVTGPQDGGREPVSIQLPQGTDTPEGRPAGVVIDKDALEEKIWKRLERDTKRLRERTGHL